VLGGFSHKSRMARARFFRPYAPLMKDPRAVRKLASSYDRRNNVPLAKFSRLSPTTWDEHVTSVLCDGAVHHGFTVDRLGVFINEDNFTGTPVVKKFAGRIVKNCNREVPRLGVLTLSQRGGNSYNFSSADPSGSGTGATCVPCRIAPSTPCTKEACCRPPWFCMPPAAACTTK